MLDKRIEFLIEEEAKRQNEGIELIASENYPSKSVREAQGSILTAKYAEGYPGKRYYGGCEIVDAIENLAIERAKKLFNVQFANVQPHSGSQANFAAYRALMGDKHGKILALTLNDGGHLTHGSPVSFSSHLYDVVFYPLDENAHLNPAIIRRALEEEKPDVFLAGYSAYPYAIDFSLLRALIDEYNLKNHQHCLFMVDMAHIAGIVAAGLCSNPCQYADIVTSTTHKTLRGPRGGLILWNNPDFTKAVNSAVFPYSQGGPLEHVIAAKAIAFAEALHPSFHQYIEQVLKNTKACSDELIKLGAVTSGTENHLFLLNVLETYGLNGKEAQNLLESNGITANKNAIHNDQLPPNKSSGLRIGFAAVTSRGADENDARKIAQLAHKILKTRTVDYREEARDLTRKWDDVLELEYPLIEA